MPQLDSKRLFIAIELPVTIKEYLGTIQATLKKSGADAKWVETENIHLTLKFLGSVKTEKIENINSIIDKIYSKKKSIPVTLNKLGGFPSINAPRVIWAALDDTTNHLKTDTLELDEKLNCIGFEKETRDFKAHITLARIRSPRNRVALAEQMLEMQDDFKQTVFSLDNVTLFESKLSPKGSTYSAIHQVKFL